MKGKMILWSLILVCLACKSDPPSTETALPESPKTFQVYSKKTPHWAKNMTLMRVDLNDPEVTLASTISNLEDWHRLGISTIILTPVYAIDEEGQVVDFTKVNPNVGTFEELLDFTRTVRRKRMRTVLEWKLPLVSVDHVWRSSNPDWFIEEDSAPTRLDLKKENLRSTLIESMKFWLRAVDVDGFSCLNSKEIPNVFWQDLRPALETIRPVIMLADSDGIAQHHEICFDATKASSFDGMLDRILDQEKTVLDFQEFYQHELASQPSTYYTYHVYSPTTLVEDRDKLIASLTFLMDGATVLESSEILQNNPKFFQRLIMLRTHNRSLGHGADGGRMKFILEHPRVLAFTRVHEGQTAIVIANCSGEAQSFTLAESLRTMSDLFTGKDVRILQDQEVSLAPWQIIVLANPGIQI